MRLILSANCIFYRQTTDSGVQRVLLNAYNIVNSFEDRFVFRSNSPGNTMPRVRQCIHLSPEGENKALKPETYTQNW